MTAAASLLLVLGACDGGGTATPSASPTGPTPTATSASPSPTPVVTSTAPTPVASSTVSAYLMKGERVQPVARTAHGVGVAAEAVRGLLAGPTAAERAGGLTSTVPSGTELNDLSIAGGLATVDLSRRFESGGGSLSMTARVAQVVFTLTAFPTVQRVAFRLDGQPVTSLGGEGVDLSKPVTRGDYEDLSPAVLVERPRWGEKVSSPLRVTGTANTFEAVFFLELRDASGRVLRQQRVMATSGTGTRGTFDATLRFASGHAGGGVLIAFTYSAKDGSRHEEMRLPVRIVR